MAELDVNLSDEHYYMVPEWFIHFQNRFDAFDRSKPKVCVSEYASGGNALINAVAEAVFLTGVERNADIVHMTSYAPLFARYGYTIWRPALIWFDGDTVVRTANYYVQQMFSCNRGDVYLTHKVTGKGIDQQHSSESRWRFGVGTWKTAAMYDDVHVTASGEERMKESFAGGPDQWTAQGGQFTVREGAYCQTDVQATPALSVHETEISSDSITYSVRAKKTGGDEGFLIYFSNKGTNRHYWWNIGLGNGQYAVATGSDAQMSSRYLLSRRPGRVEPDIWYDIRVELEGDRIRCCLNNELMHDIVNSGKQMSPAVSVARDSETGEVILKIASPSEDEFTAQINLHGVDNVDSTGTVTLLAGSRDATNTLEVPNRVVPINRTLKVGRQFTYRIPATSVQIVRIGIED
jgi:alpha-L-arabinofuranosidase